jgi:hypothetical protein
MAIAPQDLSYASWIIAFVLRRGELQHLLPTDSNGRQLYIQGKTLPDGRPWVPKDRETRVIAAIAAMVEAGKPPLKPADRPPKPNTAQDIRQAADPLKALRKEVRQIYYGELKGTLDKMEDLLGRDRSTYAPTILANYAMTLKRTMTQILKLLADVDPDVDEEPAEA